MAKYLRILFLIIILKSSNSFATSWDEPWANKVIMEASSFILAKVISSDASGIRIIVLKTVSGNELQDTLFINNFYSLRICSSSGGHGAEFQTEVVDSCYFFINQNSKGEFC